MNAIPSGPWVQTQSGRAFSLLAPAAADIDWRDIGISLGRICRFNGHTAAFYSVAQHSRLASQLVEEAIRADRSLAALVAAAEPRGPDVVAAIERARKDDEAARKLMLATLLHDGHEAYIGDIPTPVAEALAYLAGADHVRSMKVAADAAITQAAALPWPLPAGWIAVVRAVDRIMLATEKRDLLVDGHRWHHPLPAPSWLAIRPEAESIATDRFLDRLDSLLVIDRRQALLPMNAGRG